MTFGGELVPQSRGSAINQLALALSVEPLPPDGYAADCERRAQPVHHAKDAANTENQKIMVHQRCLTSMIAATIRAIPPITPKPLQILRWLGDLDSNQGCPGQSQEFYR